MIKTANHFDTNTHIAMGLKTPVSTWPKIDVTFGHNRRERISKQYTFVFSPFLHIALPSHVLLHATIFYPNEFFSIRKTKTGIQGVQDTKHFYMQYFKDEKILASLFGIPVRYRSENGTSTSSPLSPFFFSPLFPNRKP